MVSHHLLVGILITIIHWKNNLLCILIYINQKPVGFRKTTQTSTMPLSNLAIHIHEAHFAVQFLLSRVIHINFF